MWLWSGQDDLWGRRPYHRHHGFSQGVGRMVRSTFVSREGMLEPSPIINGSMARLAPEIPATRPTGRVQRPASSCPSCTSPCSRSRPTRLPALIWRGGTRCRWRCAGSPLARDRLDPITQFSTQQSSPPDGDKRKDDALDTRHRGLVENGSTGRNDRCGGSAVRSVSERGRPMEVGV
jgi:hypothetical protein